MVSEWNEKQILDLLDGLHENYTGVTKNFSELHEYAKHTKHT